jgi:hypothetical protein
VYTFTVSVSVSEKKKSLRKGMLVICCQPLGKPHVPGINFGKETIKNTILMMILFFSRLFETRAFKSIENFSRLSHIYVFFYFQHTFMRKTCTGNVNFNIALSCSLSLMGCLQTHTISTTTGAITYLCLSYVNIYEF